MMDKICGTCMWWKDYICTNEDSDECFTASEETCPHWENYDWEMYGDG